MRYFRHLHTAAALLVVAASLIAGCAAPAPAQPPSAEAPAVEAPYRPVASVREIMNSVIDPSIDIVWDSVKTVIDDGRMTDFAPTTDEDWTEVRRHALIVGEAANLLLMPSRLIAPPGAAARAPGVELEPDEVRALIDENRDGWTFFVQQLQDSVGLALAAIDARDPEALLVAGEQIDTACENCHQVFWFPNAFPSVP